MIPPDLAARVRLLNLEMVAQESATPRVEALHRIAPVTPAARELPAELQSGQYFRATITRPLPNGTFLALVAGQEVALAMDQPRKSGDTLELVVVRREGNQVWAREAASEPGHAAPPPPSNPAVQTQLSQTAALIRQLITSASPPSPLPVSVTPPAPASPQPQPVAPPAPASSQSTSVSPPAPTSSQPTSVVPPSPVSSQSTSASPPSSTPAPWVPNSPPPSSPSLVTTEPANLLMEGAHPPTTEPSPELPSPREANRPPRPPLERREEAAALGRNNNLSNPAPPLAVRAALSALDPIFAQRQAPLLPTQLADTLRRSGLFYEAHLAEWAQGRYPLAELSAEPQANIPTATRPAPSETAAIATLGGGFAPWVSWMREPLSRATPTDKIVTLVQRLLGITFDAEAHEPPQSAREPAHAGGAQPSQPSSATPSASAQAQAPASASASPIPDRLVPLVQQQLDALAQGRVDLLFSPWPGSDVRWEISNEEGGGAANASGDDRGASRWQSRVTVHSPLLGTVAFWLSIAPSGIEVAIAAESPETRALLEQRTRELLDAFAADRLPLTQLTWRPASAIELSDHGHP